MKYRGKTVGILGGMGPLATAAFFQKVVELTPAKKDWEHLRVIIDSNPHIPSRSRHFLFDEESPVPGMVDSCIRLQAYPVDFIVLPCNSASYYLDEVQARVDIPIVNIMEVTSRALSEKLPGVKRVAVLGGVITHERRTYNTFLERYGLEYVRHTDGQQKMVLALIEALKLGGDSEDARGKIRRIALDVKSGCGADALVLGCTEFGCMDFSMFDVGVPVVDSNLELARYTVKLALEG